MTFTNQPSVLDSFERTFLQAFALESGGLLRLKIEAVHERRFFELGFGKTWAFDFEDEFFGSLAGDPIDPQLASIAMSTETQRVQRFREACSANFPEHLKGLREYRVRTTSEIVSVVCQGAYRVAEQAS